MQFHELDAVSVRSPEQHLLYRAYPRAQVGDEVAKGDTLVTLEAMKMEVAVPAPAGGKVAAVRVEPSTLAQQGDVLVVIVPS